MTKRHMTATRVGNVTHMNLMKSGDVTGCHVCNVTYMNFMKSGNETGRHAWETLRHVTGKHLIARRYGVIANDGPWAKGNY
jgi:hypothetical protein